MEDASGWVEEICRGGEDIGDERVVFVAAVFVGTAAEESVVLVEEFRVPAIERGPVVFMIL